MTRIKLVKQLVTESVEAHCTQNMSVWYNEHFTRLYVFKQIWLK
jgi:hypothetical protein